MEILLGLVVLLSAGGVLYQLVGRRTESYKPLPVPIEKVSGGRVASIAGRVTKPQEPVVAPISGRRCVFYQVRVVRQLEDDGEEVICENHGTDFTVADESGEALIRMADAEVVVDRAANVESGEFDAASAAMEALLARHNETSTATEAMLAQHNPRTPGSSGNRRLRYIEGVVQEGDMVTVLGRGEWEPDPSAKSDASYREMGTRLVFSAVKNQRLVVSDR